MKFVRFGATGSEHPGVIDTRGVIRDLSDEIDDLRGEALSRVSLQRLANLELDKLRKVPADVRLGPCVGGTRNFIAIGLNYADHAAEAGAAIPQEPIVFNKAPSCIGGPYDDLVIPRQSKKMDWEVELAVIIGTRASYVREQDAMSVIAGFCVCNDVSEREFQLERSGQWTKGKGCPTFGPLGPWLVTPDEIEDVQSLSLWLDVNAQRMQNGSTRTMIFSVAHIVSYLSQFMVLEPGDVITTGTPPGVGMGMKPPKYLQAGDVIVLGIEGLGEQRQRVVAESAAS